MSDIEDEILSILNAFLSTDNHIRSEAESLYTQLENSNPEKMVNCLFKIIDSKKNTYELLLSLIKLSRFIEDSATNTCDYISASCLKRIQEKYLFLLGDGSCATVIRNYILSVIEDFIFITDGSENEWPELVPFFLSHLSDTKLQITPSTNIEFKNDDQYNPNYLSTKTDQTEQAFNDNIIISDNDTFNNDANETAYFLRTAAISFFTHFLILRPNDDLDSLVYPYLCLNSPNESERAASLKFMLISMYNKINSDINNDYIEKSGNNKTMNFISQLPQAFATLSQKYFTSIFSIFWKIFKRNGKVFSSILSGIIGLLITNFSDPSNDELFKRDSLFFFHRLYNYSKKCRKLINTDLIEKVIKIISTALQYPEIMPDLYEEAKETIYDILNNLCEKEHDDNKKTTNQNNALEIAQRYAEGSNCYVSSFFMNFFRDDMFIEKVFKNASSPNHFIRENGIFCLKKRIEHEATRDIGSFLFNKIKSKIYDINNNFNEDDYKDFVDLFCFWCQKSNKYDVEPFMKKIFDITNDHDSYLLLYCASIICCKCNQSAKYILKKVTNKLMRNCFHDEKKNSKDYEIEIDEDSNEDFINSFKLSIISNSYQCIEQNAAQENFQIILPLILSSSSSIYIINSTPFLEIMEIIGYNFIPFLDKIISHLFFLVRKDIENILPVLDCFEKIVSLFSSSNSLGPFLDSILNFAITYGTKENESESEEKLIIHENKEKMLLQMTQTEIQQIRLESIILLNLLIRNNWSNKTVYGKCLQFIMTEIPSETSENCLDALFSLVILFIEHEDEEKYKIKNESSDKDELVELIGLKKIEILEYFLSYVPFAVSKAIEKNSETLFASSASIFVLLLKRIPNEATELFFQVQKLIPHYSIYSPPVTPPSSFSSPFSRYSPTSVGTDDDHNNYNNSSNSNQLKCFSLMLWTDFVTFGPSEHTQQYLKTVIDDLKFYSEKENPLKNKNEEHFRKIAIICLYSYYTDLSKEKSDLEIETVFDEFYRIADKVNSNSTDIIEASTAAFATVLQKYVNERIFVLRTKQLIHLLDNIQRQTDESDTIYTVIFQLALLCLKNADIGDFFDPLIDLLQGGIDRRLISDSAIDDITQGIIELGDKASPRLRSIIQI
ncbi:hypothetical protein M9Y10_028567 [Tritrichomonas musculus]|uniref:MMS19 nucleotide excision repair protein n=1 Tax=Tritrichomonas musculus TaxID=1915356 RepID=A0ABR2KJR4_9EUKA